MNEIGVALALSQAIRDSIHPPPPVGAEPEVTLVRWQVRQVAPAGTRHCVGWAEYEGRVSSAVLEFDRGSRVLLTRSGRRYHLHGQPGVDPDAEWVWGRWSLANQVARWTDVSGEYSEPGGDDGG